MKAASSESPAFRAQERNPSGNRRPAGLASLPVEIKQRDVETASELLRTHEVALQERVWGLKDHVGAKAVTQAHLVGKPPHRQVRRVDSKWHAL